MLNNTQGRGLPSELWVWAIAQRWGVSPIEVTDEWPVEMIETALLIAEAEGNYAKQQEQRQKASPGASGQRRR